MVCDVILDAVRSRAIMAKLSSHTLLLGASSEQSGPFTDAHSPSYPSSNNTTRSSNPASLFQHIKAVWPHWVIGVTLLCIFMGVYQLCMMLLSIVRRLKIQGDTIFQSEITTRDRILNDTRDLLPVLFDAIIADNVVYQKKAIMQDHKIKALEIDYQAQINDALSKQRLETSEWVNKSVGDSQRRLDQQETNHIKEVSEQKVKYEKRLAQQALIHDGAVDDLHAMYAADQDLIDRLVANNEAQDVMALLRQAQRLYPSKFDEGNTILNQLLYQDMQIESFTAKIRGLQEVNAMLRRHLTNTETLDDIIALESRVAKESTMDKPPPVKASISAPATGLPVGRPSPTSRPKTNGRADNSRHKRQSEPEGKSKGKAIQWSSDDDDGA